MPPKRIKKDTKLTTEEKKYLEDFPLLDEHLVKSVQLEPLIWDHRLPEYSSQRVKRGPMFEKVVKHLADSGFTGKSFFLCKRIQGIEVFMVLWIKGEAADLFGFSCD